MKRIKIIIIVCLSVIFILLTSIFILKLNSNTKKSDNNELYNDASSIKFVKANYNYNSIEDVVFFEGEIDDDTRENFEGIATALKKSHQGKQILYLREIAGNPFGAQNLYRFSQLINGQKSSSTEMNVLVYEDGRVKFEFLGNFSWKNNTKENIKITEEQAKQITIDYLLNYPQKYKIVYGRTCKYEFYYYNSNPAWKMSFGSKGLGLQVNENYIIIDANNGNIVKEDFYVDDGIRY